MKHDMKNKKNILLVEPGYNNKYPPLGLMKIATYHKLRGDNVQFVKGCSKETRSQHWDQVYITTLFTFYWQKTIDTIKFYGQGKSPVSVGGILASLMPQDIEMATGIRPHVGPLNTAVDFSKKTDALPVGMAKTVELGGIDALPPNYGIFEGLDLPYRAIIDNFYMLRTTRGCRRKCEFCAVPTLETAFVERIPISPAVRYISENWGEKAGLLLLDDNVLVSPRFTDIIDEIRDLGFERGAMLGRRRRSVDFNQGLDVRLLTPKRLAKLATIAVRPIRLAFDDVELTNKFTQLVHRVHDAGMSEISTYVLFNHNDRPEHLYNRLQTACKLNSELGTRIYSFPMKYIPCGAKDRTHIGMNWNRRKIRSIQCILNASHGIGPTNEGFFHSAFGKNIKEFIEIIQMPEDYIINRSNPQYSKKIIDWYKCLEAMSSKEYGEAMIAISAGKGFVNFNASTKKTCLFLNHYTTEHNFVTGSRQ